MRWGIVIASFACACATEQASTVTLKQEPPRQVETVDASILPPSQHVVASANACVMLYECGCNAACTSIDRPMAELKAGMQVGVTSGPLKGERVFVAKQTTDSGDDVLTVQRADPKSPIMVCGVPRSGAFGYGCSVKDSGRARACQSCE
jgi:hypothetical protein